MNSADHEAAVVVAPPPIRQTSHNKPRLSKRRWLLLMGICVFGFLNGFVNEMTAILSTLTDLLGLQLDEYVYISQVFNYIKPLAALPSAWFVDRFGIRNTMYLALVLAIVRNSSRALLFYSPAPVAAQIHDKHEALTSLKFLYWTLSSVSESLTIVVYFTCLPLRISESWFPKEERSFAWSSIYMVPFMGASLAAFVLPRLIVGPQSNHLLAELNLACLLVSVFAVILTCDRSRPQEAPSARSLLAEQQLKRAQFFRDLKNVLSFQFILQLMITCGFEAMSASIKSVFQDVLCATLGLPQVFCGNLLALNSLVMIIMQLIGSWHMDKRKQRQHQDSRREQCRAGAGSTGVKLLASLQWLTFMFHLSCLSAGSLLRANQWWLVAVSMLLHSVASSWAAPHYNDTLANLITGRLSQATTSAVRLAFYIMLNNPFQSLFVFLRQVDTTSGQASYALSMAFAALMMTSMTLVYVCCFRGAATVAEATAAGSVERLEPVSDGDESDSSSSAAPAPARAPATNGEETNSARQR